MQNVQILPVEWNGKLYELPVCYSAERVAELLARWPRGVIELDRIFEHESPSSERARSFIVSSVLKLAGERLPLTAATGLAEQLRGTRAPTVRQLFERKLDAMPIKEHEHDEARELFAAIAPRGRSEQARAALMPERMTRAELRAMREHAAATKREADEAEAAALTEAEREQQGQAERAARQESRAALMDRRARREPAPFVDTEQPPLTDAEVVELENLRIKHKAPTSENDHPSARDQLRFLRELDTEAAAEARRAELAAAVDRGDLTEREAAILAPKNDKP